MKAFPDFTTRKPWTSRWTARLFQPWSTFMTPGHRLGYSLRLLLQSIHDGYKTAGFDTAVLEQAIDYTSSSWKANRSRNSRTCSVLASRNGGDGMADPATITAVAKAAACRSFRMNAPERPSAGPLPPSCRRLFNHRAGLLLLSGTTTTTTPPWSCASMAV